MGPLDSALDLGNTRYSFTFVPNVENPLAPKVVELNKIGATIPISWELIADATKEKKMTQTFKVGNRVKLTKDDEVIITTLVAGKVYAQQAIVAHLGGGYAVEAYTAAGWEVEKLSPPLPETPGSVILYEGEYWVRGLGEYTRDQWGSVEDTRDSDELEGEYFEVFFDAGADGDGDA